MKRMFFVLMMLLAPVAIFAQTVVPTPTDVSDVLTNFTVWVGSFLSVVGLTIFLTATVLKLFNVTGSGLKQLISWGTGFVLVAILSLLHLGFANDLTLYGVLAYAVAVALGANRLFDIKLLESILSSLHLRKNCYRRFIE